MNIGEKIKAKRMELGWSQQKLADLMGYTSKSTITKIEKGVSDVGQRNIEKFAEVLGVSIAYLMDWEETDKSYNKDNLFGLDYEFIENYHQLDEQSQRLVDSLIELLRVKQPDSGKVLEMIGKLSAILHS